MYLEFYGVALVLSIILLIIYIYKWHRHFDVNITAIFIFIPIYNLAYFLMCLCDNVESAAVMLKIMYIPGCLLPWFVTFSILSLCKIDFGKYFRTISFIINILVYTGVLTVGYSNLFYKSLKVEKFGNIYVPIKEYGPLHTVFYICVGTYLVIGLVALIYSIIKKNQVSRIILILLFLPDLTTVTDYYFSRMLPNFTATLSYLLRHSLGDMTILNNLDFLPYDYVIALVIYLLIVRRMAFYDVSDMVIESMVQAGETGFITVDLNHRYLGSNKTAKKIMPALNKIAVDYKIDGVDVLNDNIIKWIKHFEDDPESFGNTYVINGMSEELKEESYEVNINHLYHGKKKVGYQIFLKNNTQSQKYISLLDSYNSELEEEVAAKTERLVMMHNNLVLSMATMVESRDNSTGGHIKRTSEGVRILINEIKKDNEFSISESFCDNIIKAAPMHDLGKIAVDDAILRKPGRFTPEEFEVMKRHAAEGARIVHDILKGTNDEEFHILAENVAHYHHERVDGSGYPEGLKGDEIPLEARIMAIADVYDALVSKRVYKEAMSFEKADSIIMEGMGTQFDEKLKKYYVAARPKLEEYYSKQA